ncbi:MAG TPA: methyltransferase domain-containing protein [Hyphomicrobium sp.]|nr:methyltransferase domain-containing protein [Hyphomicrobium sp.]
MTRIAPFVPDRFTSAIPHYINGRPPYSERLVERLAREAHLGRHSRVLDLGCGPGSLTMLLARHCDTVIGIDADPAMIEAARSAANAEGASVEWRVGSSFDLDPSLAPLDLVTIARAFHWMDRDATLQSLDKLIAPGGAIALVSTELHDFGAARWHGAFEEARRGHGRFDEFYHWRKSDAFESHPSVLMRSPFSDVERIAVFDVRTPGIDEIVARALSFSANSPSALGPEGRAAYEAELRERMLALCPDGLFPEIVESIAIIARRPE